MHNSITIDRVIGLIEQNFGEPDNLGLCRACGFEQDGVEPDATGYPCENCGELEVTGIEVLLLCIS